MIYLNKTFMPHLAVFCLPAVLFSLLLIPKVSAETYQLQTSYPSPYGAYHTLKSGVVGMVPQEDYPECNEKNLGYMFFDKYSECPKVCVTKGWKCMFGEYSGPIAELTMESSEINNNNYYVGTGDKSCSNCYTNVKIIDKKKTKLTQFTNLSTALGSTGNVGVTIDTREFGGRSFQLKINASAMIRSDKGSDNNLSGATFYMYGKPKYASSEGSPVQLYYYNLKDTKYPKLSLSNAKQLSPDEEKCYRLVKVDGSRVHWYRKKLAGYSPAGQSSTNNSSIDSEVPYGSGIYQYWQTKSNGCNMFGGNCKYESHTMWYMENYNNGSFWCRKYVSTHGGLGTAAGRTNPSYYSLSQTSCAEPRDGWPTKGRGNYRRYKPMTTDDARCFTRYDNISGSVEWTPVQSGGKYPDSITIYPMVKKTYKQVEVRFITFNVVVEVY